MQQNITSHHYMLPLNGAKITWSPFCWTKVQISKAKRETAWRHYIVQHVRDTNKLLICCWNVELQSVQRQRMVWHRYIWQRKENMSMLPESFCIIVHQSMKLPLIIWRHCTLLLIVDTLRAVTKKYLKNKKHKIPMYNFFLVLNLRHFKINHNFETILILSFPNLMNFTFL